MVLKTKITKRKTIKVKYTIFTLLVFIPLILVGAFGGFIFIFFTDLATHAYSRDMNFYDPYDPNYPWNSMENITNDLDLMDDLADTYQTRLLDWHTPINLSIDTQIWNNGTVKRYHLTDNGGEWTGTPLATECFRYQTLTDPGEKAQSLQLIKKMVTGLSLLIAVPNGGLGPDFHGQTLARFYAMPELVNDANYSEMFSDEHYKMFNGTDGSWHEEGVDYSQWRVRLYTSKDELGGYFYGVSAALMLCDDPWVQDTIRKIIGQITNGFIDSMYQEIHGDGNPCGAHLENMLTLASAWKLVLMKMATIAYPENNRYTQLYNYYCSREMYLLHSPHVGESNTVDEYYANSFLYELIMSYVLLEDEPVKLNRFIKTYERDYKLYRYQRNAQANAVFLAFNAKRTTQSTRYTQEDLDEILWDTLDQLHQFTAYPIYNDSYGGKDVSARREDYGGTWMQLDPSIQKWKNWFDYNPIGKLFRWLPGELMNGMLDNRYLRPKTASMYRISTFMWCDNPYSGTDNLWHHSRRNSEYVIEPIGISYTLPYYLLKYYGYLDF
ncbi:MAG: hypothetical protein ACTSRE_11535 [Promethearchaeota archaeon]